MRIQESTATAKDDVENIMKLIDGGDLEADAVKAADHPRPCFRAADCCRDSSNCQVVNERIIHVVQKWVVDAVVQYARVAFGSQEDWRCEP